MNKVSCHVRAARIVAALVFVFAAGGAARAVPIVALFDGNVLALIDSATPEVILRSGQITGLPASETIVAVDFRPATGQLYALGRTSRLYVVHPVTLEAVRAVGNGPFSPVLHDGVPGFDFDPARDLIRITTADTPIPQNLLVNPDPRLGGAASIETYPEFAPGDSPSEGPLLFGLAYDNNFAGTTHTRLYAIHRGINGQPRLVRVSQGNAAQARTVGPLLPAGTGNNVSREIGFDIAPVSGVAYAALKTNSPTILRSRLYVVSLANGSTRPLGEFGMNGPVLDIAVAPPRYVVHAVNDKNELIKFDSAYPETLVTRQAITGMNAGEQIYELDFHPDGQLYGLGRTTDGSVSRLYRIDPDTAAATRTSSSGAPLDPAPVGDAGLDFRTDGFSTGAAPRLVTSSDQNLGLGLPSGAVTQVGTPLAFAAGDPNAGRNPSVVTTAHANVFPGNLVSTHAHVTTQYSIHLDTSSFGNDRVLLLRHALAHVTLPDPGTLFTVAPINGVGIPVDHVGFDVAHGARAPAFATFISMDDGISKFYVLDLKTGGTSFVNVVGNLPNDFDGRRVRDLAVAPNGRFDVSVPSEVLEDYTSYPVTISRTGDDSNEATVDYATTDGTINAGGAHARTDYTAVRGTAFFAAGQTEVTVHIPINDDAIRESGVDHGVPFSGETFLVSLTNPTAGFTLPSFPSTALALPFIRDDGDGDLGHTTIDGTENFVNQHYHDFLSREPDAGGLAFWMNNIESCGADEQCREVKRIDTSAAFFLSIEFQETGFLVYRAYKAAFNRAPAPVRLAEFYPDTQRIGRGVVVTRGDWELRLEDNKRAFFDDFVMRDEFRAQYPATLTAAEFVDALNANTGGALSQPERDALVADLDAQRVNRADVLRAVADDPDLRRSETNRAFVLMQYFGYLRRNPDEHPDTNFNGYLFWLDKLEAFDGDFRRAEMVKAFITSIEYRRRFGQ